MSSERTTSERLNQPGATIGPYQIEKRLGHGGMGAVYRVRHLQSGLPYALKVVLGRPDLPENAWIVERFQREAEILAKVDAHPGVVRVHAVGVHEGTPWCAMELLDGPTLHDVLAEGRMDPGRAVQIVAEIGRAVEHLHRHGVIHRDLKPANVIIDEDGRPRVVDFGLARDQMARTLTRTGEMLGTPKFMAPEQIAHGIGEEDPPPIGPRTDVYGLGGLLYSALCGRAPFEGESAQAVIIDVVGKDPDPLWRSNPDAPADLERVCLRALEKVPEHRYPSAAAFVADLERWQRGESVEASSPGAITRVWRRFARPHARRSRVTVAVAVVLAVAAAASAGVFYAMPRSVEALPLESRVTAVEAAVDRAGRIGPAERAEIARLLEATRVANGAPDGLSARVEALDALDRLLHLEDAPAGQAADALAALVRRGGEVDTTALARCQRLLLGGRRLVALDRLLHGAEPVVSAAPPAAAALARAMLDRPELAPPADEAAFGVLLRAEGVGPGERGRLRLRRAEAALAARPARLDAAIDDLVATLREDAVVPELPDWPAALEQRAVERFGELLDRDLAAAADLLAVIVRVPEPRTAPLSLPAVLSLQGRVREAAAAIGLGIGDPAGAEQALERAALAAALLEARGGSPLSYERIDELWGGMPSEWILARAERERNVSATRRNPAVLVLLARLLLEVEWDKPSLTEDDKAAVCQWVAAASEVRIEAAWLDTQASYTLYYADAVEEATERARRAYERASELPADRRWPLTIELHSDLLRTAAQPDGAEPDIAALQEAGRLALEALRLQARLVSRLVEIEGAGGVAPWMLSRRWAIAQLLGNAGYDLVMALDPPDCCAEPASGLLEAMVDGGLALDAADDLSASLHHVRAVHLRKHGAVGRALEAARLSVERLREHGELWGEEDERARQSDLATYLEELAGLLRAAGRLDAALAAEREAHACRVAAGEAEPGDGD